MNTDSGSDSDTKRQSTDSRIDSGTVSDYGSHSHPNFEEFNNILLVSVSDQRVAWKTRTPNFIIAIEI